MTVTQHTTTVGGKIIKYKATAGYMVLKEYGAKSKLDEQGGGQDKEKSSDKDKDKRRMQNRLQKSFLSLTRGMMPAALLKDR